MEERQRLHNHFYLSFKKELKLGLRCITKTTRSMHNVTRVWFSCKHKLHNSLYKRPFYFKHFLTAKEQHYLTIYTLLLRKFKKISRAHVARPSYLTAFKTKVGFWSVLGILKNERYFWWTVHDVNCCPLDHFLSDPSVPSGGARFSRLRIFFSESLM